MKSCFNILVLILNLHAHRQILDHDNGLSNDKTPQFASLDLTCDSMIGPPCEAYNFSDFIMFTILDTNLFM